MRDHLNRALRAATPWLLFLAVTSLASAAPSTQDPLLVNAGWLAGKLGEVRVVDYGRTSADYAQGHLPGAVFLDRAAVYATIGGVEGELPPVDQVVRALEAAGISSTQPVVVYDGSNGLWAARLFWALEYLGHPRVHLLDGGLARWKADGRSLETAAPRTSRTTFQAVLQPQRLATKQWVESNLATPSVFVLDARSRGEYVGEDVRAARGGHVPGAVNLDWVLNLEEGAGGTFLGETELREMYDSIGVSNQGETVTLCQTGVRAAHTYFVLRNLGYDNVRMYDGSWAEWGNDASAPIVAGSSQR